MASRRETAPSSRERPLMLSTFPRCPAPLRHEVVHPRCATAVGAFARAVRSATISLGATSVVAWAGRCNIAEPEAVGAHAGGHESGWAQAALGSSRVKPTRPVRGRIESSVFCGGNGYQGSFDRRPSKERAPCQFSRWPAAQPTRSAFHALCLRGEAQPGVGLQLHRDRRLAGLPG